MRKTDSHQDCPTYCSPGVRCWREGLCTCSERDHQKITMNLIRGDRRGGVIPALI
ncbi:hypothetical protein ASZ90_011056 [hydrocarbon metagenome]|uniref:Uncharacterized protein n=1 Tax=hydrocarbon metagenome TaxID=938273 RepID=A0A0W8FEB1_9ZZZZ